MVENWLIYTTTILLVQLDQWSTWTNLSLSGFLFSLLRNEGDVTDSNRSQSA